MYIAVAAYADRTRFLLFNNNYVFKRHHKMTFFWQNEFKNKDNERRAYIWGGWVAYNRKGVRVYWYMGL